MRMIEILKNGNSKRKMECGKCHCIFTYTDTDIVINKNRDYVVNCPECNYEVDIVFSYNLNEEEDW